MTAETSSKLKCFPPVLCLPHLLQCQAERFPDAPAILAPGRAALSYGRLYQHVEHIGRVLRAMGIGRHDRVAVELPNGPEMAVAILAVAANASCVPINPAYQAEELDRYFADLRPRALITQADINSAAWRVALSRGIRIIELWRTSDAPAGLFTLTGEQVGAPFHEPVSSSDVAVLLMTSGTTSRPRIVPQTHANVCASIYSSVAAFALRESDRCLNILPLFHGHALINMVMASLAAGASVVCAPGYDINGFVPWLTSFQVTWYSAVPTIHQAILSQARDSRERLAGCRLRFIRSSSAPLSPNILMELESTFEAPVIESYAMTETTSTLIASNPLPPRQRKARSVGVPVSLDVAIMDEGGSFLAQGQIGEIVVRGAGVMPGYDGDPMATQSAFAGDWFKTGDLGFFDGDGYLFLTGRSREIINRGGEKITPREIDEVLLEHPEVAEAATFAVPHPTLGEDVGSAVVLRQHGAATPEELRQFLIGRVAEFKVPRHVLIVRRLPRGPTGKLRRVDLAVELGLTGRMGRLQNFVAPRTRLESLLSERWADILQVERVGINDNFFALGGDSLLVAHVVAHIYNTLHLEINVSCFFEAPTVAETAQYLEAMIQSGQIGRPSSAVRLPRTDTVPASIAQEYLWKLQRVLRDTPFFNVFCPLRVTSPLDTAILDRAINELVQRHEILRTTFADVEGQCIQVIAPRSSVHFTLDDLRALPYSKKKDVGNRAIQEEALHSFDLAEGPLFRIRLVRLAKQEHLLLITIHSIIVDGWSFAVLIAELFTLYDAFYCRAASPLAPLSIQYADFAHWQRRWRSHPDVALQLAYWREQLRDPPPLMRFGNSPQIETVANFRTARRKVILPASLSDAAKQFSVREGGTLYMVLVAAFKTLLQRYLGQDDLLMATLVANRIRPGTEGLVGPLANTIILRADLGGDPSLREVMRRVRTTVLAAFAHQDIPFEELVDVLERERPLSPAASPNVMITLHNATLRPRSNPGHLLTFEEADPNVWGPLVAPTTLDICLMFRETPHGVTGSCIYKPHLFDVMTIDRLLQDFQEVLRLMITHPERSISEIRVSLNGESPNP
jgi:acyl-CoA synthetase (AMP-forming)/AMP-acid ligase II/acyl carrier protein